MPVIRDIAVTLLYSPQVLFSFSYIFGCKKNNKSFCLYFQRFWFSSELKFRWLRWQLNCW